MRSLVYPYAREPIIPFCAAVRPQPGRILGEQNGGSARVYWPSYHLVSVPAIMYVPGTLASVPLDIYAGHRVQRTRAHAATSADFPDGGAGSQAEPTDP
jgi:hypothetical protein